MNLGILSRVDPRDLAINNRYKTNAVLPKRVRDAKTNLQDDVFEEVIKAKEQGWEPPTYAEVFLHFGLSVKGDLDGPIKHTIDAMQDGINKAGFDWNDKYIYTLHVYRVGGKETYVCIQSL